MDEPAWAPFRAARNAPVRDPIIVEGYDLTDAVMRAQVRLRAGASGSPPIDLATVTTAGQQGLRFVSVEWADGIPTSTVEICIDKATMQATPPPPPSGADVDLEWDMHVAPPGETEFRLLEGTFTVTTGVTR